MKNLRNKNAPPPETAIQTFLSSSWDKVLAVYAKLPEIEELADAIIAGDIEDFLTAQDIDTIEKLNAILTNADLGDFASQAEAEAGVSTTKTMSPLRVAQAIAVFASTVPNNYEGLGPPTVNNDSSEGYAAGSVWIDTIAVPNESYRCSDPTVGAAVWLKTTLTADELALVALTGNSDDLVEGLTKLLMTVAERSKLTGIEAGATADQSASEIEAGYNAQVPVATQLEAEAGVLTDVRRWTPQRISQAINALTIGGVVWSNANTSINVAKNTGTVFYALSASVVATLPAAPAVGDMLVVVNNDSTPGSPWMVQVNAGGSNEIHYKSATAISSWSVVPGYQATLICYDAGATKKWHIVLSSVNASTVDGVYIDADASAFAGKMYFVDSAIGTITMTLPSNPPPEAYIPFADVGNNASVNNITIDRNGKTINGAASNFIIDVNGGRVELVFNYDADTWEFRHDFAVEDSYSEADIQDIILNGTQTGLPPFNNRQLFSAGSLYDGTTPVDFGAFTRVEAAVGAPTYSYRTASGTVDQEGQWQSALTERYNVDTHGFKFHVLWMPTTAGAGDVKFELSLVGVGDGDLITNTFVVGTTVVDSCQLSATKVHITPVSAAFTLTTSQFKIPGIYHGRLRRLATDPQDTYASDIRILGFVLHCSPRSFNDVSGNDF